MNIKEMRRLDLIDLRKDLGWHGSLKKIEDRTGIDAGYIGRCCLEEGKKEKRNIGDKTVESLDNAFPGWRKRELEQLGKQTGSGTLITIAQKVEEAPAPFNQPNISGLMSVASPNTYKALEKLQNAYQAGKLTQEDLDLLDAIARRLTNDQDGENR